MTTFGIMVEGQEDLTWDRLFGLAQVVEDLGFETLFRSDHLTGLQGAHERAALALWPSLAALALRTSRLRFGPLVCSMTFHHPAILAKNAAAVDVLSNGRLELGLGAGWHDGEHRMFGVDFPPYKTRLERLDEGAQVIKALWTGKPVSMTGKHFTLQDAETYPLPAQNPMPVIMGGQGKLTLRAVARHASEWNSSYASLEMFIEKSHELDGNCAAIGRDPASLRRSMMVPYVIGSDAAAVQRHIDAVRVVFPNLPANLEGWRAAGHVGGSPEQIIEHLERWRAAGCDRFVLQHLDMDNLDALALVANEVMPHFS